MQINFGYDHFGLKNGHKTVIRMDTEKLINGHFLGLGTSGVGKSVLLRDMITQAEVWARAYLEELEIHVMDVHGDLIIENASSVQFSEHSPYGLNPLVINPDIHFGGVRKCINRFLQVLEQSSSKKLGVTQEGVIRDLLTDVFREFGFDDRDPTTWSLNEVEAQLVSKGADNRIYLEVPIADKDTAKAFGARWEPQKKLWWVHTENYKGELLKWKPAFKLRTYPTLTDVINYAKNVFEQRFFGADQKAVVALAAVNKTAQQLQRRRLQAMKEQRYNDKADKELEDLLEDAKFTSISAFTESVRAIRTGEELDFYLKYDQDVLKTVLNRLRLLETTGIYKGKAPPFNPASIVRRYQLNALAPEEKKMLVLFRLQEIFNDCVQKGPTKKIRTIVVLDELATYTTNQDADGGDGIIGVIAREARKFGLALWAATQTPTNVPESLISAVGTRVIIGLDERYVDGAVRQMGIDKKLIQWVQPWHTLAVQLKEAGSVKNKWWWTQIRL